VRHPFYVSGLLLAFGFSLATANGLFLPLAAIAAGFISARTPLEEARLVARFGDDYRHYMGAVGGFVPRRRR
jgi:protein-S-isoprenylcysteine O-methyltransferase Ste14